ncbi:hypothetical protein [Dryocola sp. LX212]|jgi:hypothetical protein
MNKVLGALCLIHCQTIDSQRGICDGTKECPYRLKIHTKLQQTYLEISESGIIVDAMLSCNPARQNILVFMASVMGADFLAMQYNFLQYVIDGNWSKAAWEVEHSSWGRENNTLATYCSNVMKLGIWSLPSDLDALISTK